MAKFELRNIATKQLVNRNSKFEATIDPTDGTACRDLLARTAVAEGAKVEKVFLRTWDKYGRKIEHRW